MRLVLVVVLGLLGQALCGATVAHAQQEGGLGGFFQRLFGTEPDRTYNAPDRRYAPDRTYIAPDRRFDQGRPRLMPMRPPVPAKPRRTKPRASPFATPAPEKAQVEAKEPDVPPSVFVNVIGDSLAEMLADGLSVQFAD